MSSKAAQIDKSTRSTSEGDTDSTSLEIIYSTGWRVWSTTLGVALAIAATNIEATIIGTSLVTIVEELHGFEKQGWVVTAYLITYTSFIIIWSKISSVFGRKTASIASIVTFTAFSGGCGAAQTINQLIIMRAFQGIGAGGCMSTGIAMIYDLVPKSKYPSFNAMITAFSALGALAGPIIGGALADSGQWRWVFLVNVPIGALIAALLIIAVPANIPYQNNSLYVAKTWKEVFSASNLGRLDLSGNVLLVAGSVLLMAAILEGGSTWDWNSATSIALFIVSGVIFILFLINERFVSNPKRRQEPLFPWSWLFHRAWLGVLLTSVLAAVPYNTITINLPQRFQLVEGDSPLHAGERLIPFNFCVAFGAVLSSIIAMKIQVAPIFLMFFGGVIESVGVGLLSSLPTLGSSPNIIYFYEILAGMGMGMVFGMLITIPPSLVEERHKDIAGGAIFQTRVFGGALGLAISSTALNNYLTSHLGDNGGSILINPSKTLSKLSGHAREDVISTFSKGYALDAQIMVAFASAQICSIALLWKRPQVALEGIGKPKAPKDEAPELATQNSAPNFGQAELPEPEK